MTTTFLDIDDQGVTMRVSNFSNDDVGYYSFTNDDYFAGTIQVKPARFGMHPIHGVMLTFGSFNDHVDAGDWALSGTVLVTGTDLLPGPHPYSKGYPINQIRADDPDTADLVSNLAQAIALHYITNYTGTGLR